MESKINVLLKPDVQTKSDAEFSNKQESDINMKNKFGQKNFSLFGRTYFNFQFAGHFVQPKIIPGFLRDPRGVVVFLRKEFWYFDLEDMMSQIKRWETKQKILVMAKHLKIIRPCLILSAGTWDLQLINVKYFVNHALPALHHFFNYSKHDSVFSKIKIFVTTAPAIQEAAHQDQKHLPAKRNLGNNALIAAAMDLLTQVVEPFDHVTLVDWFAMTVSRTLKASDKIHYITKEEKVLNDVGWTMTRLLFEHLCL